MAAFTTSGLTQAQMAALKATADAMSAPGKGFLASDESAGPWLRAGHVDAKKIEDTAENRAAYRSMLYKTPGLSEYVSGAAPRQVARRARGARAPRRGDVRLRAPPERPPHPTATRARARRRSRPQA